MSLCDWVYLDGRLQLARDARIPIFDRGVLFGQAVYEVTAVVGGVRIDAAQHLARLERSLVGIDLPLPMGLAEIDAIEATLRKKNRLEEGVIYLQVTAGDYGDRDFTGPEHLRPRLFAFCQARPFLDEKAWCGVAAITLPDTRWARRDLKTTQLLSQVLAYRQARKAAACSAIMHQDGFVTEAASANVWVVDPDGGLATPALSPAILAGVTRQALIDDVVSAVEERPIALDALRGAREVFLSSTGAMVLPVTALDGEAIGNGQPGQVTRRIQRAYCARIGISAEKIATVLG